MQTLQIQLPDTINIDVQEIQMLLASKLYEKGVLSVRASSTNDRSFQKYFYGAVGALSSRVGRVSDSVSDILNNILEDILCKLKLP